MTILERLETALSAHYIEDITSGHMGARIMRFQSNNGTHRWVVKIASTQNKGARLDLSRNYVAYSALQNIGARNILPNVRTLHVEGFKGLIMEDVGQVMSVEDSGNKMFRRLIKHLFPIIEDTLTDGSDDGETEVLRHMRRFLPRRNPLSNLIQLSRPKGAGMTKVALMSLDFTPDNVAVRHERMYFIDPWKQRTYLGNPAVSIGQFATLAKLYKMQDAEEGATMLARVTTQRLPKLLGTNREVILRGLRLGETLQYALSAFVRRRSDPVRSKELLAMAYTLWK